MISEHVVKLLTMAYSTFRFDVEFFDGESHSTLGFATFSFFNFGSYSMLGRIRCCVVFDISSYSTSTSVISDVRPSIFFLSRSFRPHSVRQRAVRES